MRPNEVRREISQITSLLLELGVAIDANSTIENRNGQKIQIVWSSAKAISQVFPTSYATISEYRKLLEDRQYNFLLFDGSFVQASYSFSHMHLDEHRLLFYPCPVRLGADDIAQEFSVMDAVDKYIIESLENLEWITSVSDAQLTEPNFPALPRLQMKAPIRFDFDRFAQSYDHPASHAHILDPDCRIPVYGPLSFSLFMKFIIKNFYKPIWISQSRIKEFPIRQFGKRTIAGHEENEMHLNSKNSWF